MAKVLKSLIVTFPFILAACKPRHFGENKAKLRDLPVAVKNDDQIDLLRYVYNGPLPMLENPEINASMKGLTVRVSGELPQSWIDAQKSKRLDWKDALPFYALVDSETPKPKISVVYPMASTASALKSLNDPNRFVGQDAGGTYYEVEVNPWRTDGGDGYGGFPFIHYTFRTNAGIAFHGPIDLYFNERSFEKQWFLQRGYVSHGCKRMQAEHVVEMAHLIGVNMKKIYSHLTNANSNWPRVKVKMRMFGMNEGYDTYQNKPLDVKYYVSYTSDDWIKKGVPQVVRALDKDKKAFLAPTWDARDFPYAVCPVKDAKQMIGQEVADDYCRKNYLKDKFPEANYKKDPRPEEEYCESDAGIRIQCFAKLDDH